MNPIKSIKLLIEEFSLLPSPVKFFIYSAFSIVLVTSIYFGTKSFVSDRQIKSLEKMNQQLEKAAVVAQDKAKQAEFNAATENLRSNNLETQLKSLQEKTNSQDVKIQTQSNKVTAINNRIIGIRKSKSKPISTDELENKLRNRYGQENSY